jgi:hypothetical protein
MVIRTPFGAERAQETSVGNWKLQKPNQGSEKKRETAKTGI